MHVSMICHPDTPSSAALAIDVTIARQPDGQLWMRYYVEIPIESLALPEPADPDRTDGLWQTTCFEAFVRFPHDRAYLECNFSPSSRWAAYLFDDYRSGQTDFVLRASPQIGLDASESHFALEATFTLPAPWQTDPIDLALSAVIEETGGTKSYWALRHPPGPPDFHHPDCFALALPAPGAA